MSIVFVVSQVSQPWSRTDLTFELRIGSLVCECLSVVRPSLLVCSSMAADAAAQVGSLSHPPMGGCE